MNLLTLIRKLSTAYDQHGSVDVVIGPESLELLDVKVDEPLKPYEGGDTVVVLVTGD